MFLTGLIDASFDTPSMQVALALGTFNKNETTAETGNKTTSGSNGKLFLF
jgi:hypothetical protein